MLQEGSIFVPYLKLLVTILLLNAMVRPSSASEVPARHMAKIDQAIQICAHKIVDEISGAAMSYVSWAASPRTPSANSRRFTSTPT